jgi:lysophospholipid acyltransferase (LPLAT)-like uncharacterized protein
MKKALPWLSALIIRAITATLRITTEDNGGILDKPERDPVIMAFWHNRTFLMAIFYEKYCWGNTTFTFISRSRDGQFMADVARQFGVMAVRGSSSRHGVSATLAALHKARDEKVDITITPDGPRGPRYDVHAGILRLAQSTQRPIVAIDCRLGWKIVLRKSWDGFRIPLPFSRCHLRTARPIHVPADATEAELEVIKKRVADALGGD